MCFPLRNGTVHIFSRPMQHYRTLQKIQCEPNALFFMITQIEDIMFSGSECVQFLLWRNLKQKSCRNNPKTLVALQTEIKKVNFKMCHRICYVD
jgi:hypothetical protein